MDHWKGLKGLSEESSIRRAIREAQDGPLKGQFVERLSSHYNPRTSFAIEGGPVIFRVIPDGELMNGSTIWLWKERMRYAHSYVLNAPRVTFVEVDSVGFMSTQVSDHVPESRPTPDFVTLLSLPK